MNEIYVFGHKNPDTDSICSSYAYSLFKNSLGFNTQVFRLGEFNMETKFVFDFLNLEQPPLLEKIEDNQAVILIDHNEFQQSVENIENAKIIEVIDHHRVDNFHTAQPLYMTLKPYGCSATIIYEIMKNENYTPNKIEATLLCSAIISDSLLFKSPTCTQKDEKVCRELAEIAEIDLEKYGLEMLKAGTNLDAYSPNELLEIDSKNFETTNGLVNVCQINTVDIDDVLKQEEEIKKALLEKKDNENLSQIIIMITDIMNANSLCIVFGNENNFEKSFDVQLIDNKAHLKGVVSRKKQIVPKL